MRAMKKVWMLRNLKNMGGSCDDLMDVYIKHVRSIAEYAVPVWNYNITQKEVIKLERIQKISVAIIKGQYESYTKACQELNILTLKERRSLLCEKMAKKAATDDTFKDWFCENDSERITRQPKPFFKPVPYKSEAFKKSPIPEFTEILNSVLSQD